MMLARSALQLFTSLQAHGFSLSLMQLLVAHCEAGHTGHVTLHTKEGRIAGYEQRVTGRVEDLGERETASNSVMPSILTSVPLDTMKKEATI